MLTLKDAVDVNIVKSPTHEKDSSVFKLKTKTTRENMLEAENLRLLRKVFHYKFFIRALLSSPDSHQSQAVRHAQKEYKRLIDNHILYQDADAENMLLP